jgi:hypothetical protein
MLIPKYPLDTAAKLALIRAAGWYYDTKKRTIFNAARLPVAFTHQAPTPLNAAFDFFIKNHGKKPMDWGEFGAGPTATLKYKALNRYQFGIGDQRAIYGTT